MTSEIIAFLTASFLLTISPGPDIIFVLVQAMRKGWKAGVVIALGLVTGILVHTSLVAFGVSALIRENPSFFLLIKLMGAAYLFWLGWTTWRSDPRIIVSSTAGFENREILTLYRRGFLMNVLNPKVTLFFLVFLPGFLWDPLHAPILQFYILGGLFMIQALFVFATVAMTAGRITEYLERHQASGKIFKAIQIGVYVGAGIYILV